MIQTDIVELPLVGGLSLRGDRKTVPTVKVLELVNGQFNAPGEIGRRNGMLSTNFSAVSGADAIFNLEGQTLAHAPVNNTPSLLAYSKKTSTWMNQGAFPVITPSVKTVVANNNSQSDISTAVLGGLIAISWIENHAVWYQVREISTGVILANRLLQHNGAVPRVVACQSFFAITYCLTQYGRRNIKMAIVGISTPSSVTYTLNLSSSNNLAIVGDIYGVASTDSKIHVVWAVSGGLRAVAWSGAPSLWDTSSVVTILPPAGTNSHYFGAINVCECQNGSVVIAYWDTSGQAIYASIATVGTLGTFAGPPLTICAPGTCATLRNLGVASWGGSSDPVYFAIAWSANSSLGASYASTYCAFCGIEGFAASVSWKQMGLVAKPWFADGCLYFLGCYESEGQSTYFVVGSDIAETFLAAKILPGDAGGLSSSPCLPDVGTIRSVTDNGVTGSVYIASEVHSRLVSTGGTLSNINSVSLITLDSGDQPTSTQAAGSLIFSGGFPRAWDGNSLVELGYHLYPDKLVCPSKYSNKLMDSPSATATLGTRAGLLSSGTEYYRVSAVNGVGETIASAEVSVAVSTGNVADLAWGAVDGASGYKIYKSTSAGTEHLLQYVEADTLAWTDDGLLSVGSGTLSDTNTTGDNYNLPLANPTLAGVAEYNLTGVSGMALQATGTPVVSGHSGFDAAYQDVDGLSPDANPYSYKVRAISAANGLAPAINGPFTDILTVNMQINDNVINLTWPAVAGASSYEVWGRWDNESFGYIATVTTNSFEDGGSVVPNPSYSNGLATVSASILPGSSSYTYAFAGVLADGREVALPSTHASCAVSNSGCTIVALTTGYHPFLKIYRWTTEAPTPQCWATIANPGHGTTIVLQDGGQYVPEGSSLDATQCGGSLTAKTYYYRITSVSEKGGETTGSNEISVTLGNTGGVVLTWNQIVGSGGYRLYRGDTGAASEKLLVDELTLGSTTTTWTDTGAVSLGTKIMPTADTSSQTDNSYEYVATYAWTDANGLVHRSAPSPVLEKWLQEEIGPSNSLQVTIPTLQITAKSNVQIELWRTLLNESVFYLAGIASNSSGNTVTIVDGTLDDVLDGNQMLYTTGNVLENMTPGAVVCPTYHKGRIFAIDAANRKKVVYTKELQEGAPVEFNDFLSFVVDEQEGDLTAIASMDQHLVLFKDNRIFVSDSDGFGQQGQGDNFTNIVPLPGDFGATDPGSVVSSAAGVFFRGLRGICLLTRGLTIDPTGIDILPLLDSQTVQSACVIPDRFQVRFMLANSETVLVWDWAVGQWSEYVLPVASVSSSVLNSTYSALGSDGKIRQESASVYMDDSAQIPMTVKTVWVKPGGMTSRWNRTRRIQALGEKGAGDFLATMTVRTGYLDNDPQAETVQVDSSKWGASGAGPVSFEIHLGNQKSSSVQVEITDQGPSTPSDPGLRLSSLSFECGLLRGTSKLGKSKKY